MKTDARPAPHAADDHAAASLPEGHARQSLRLAMRVLDLAEVYKKPNDMSQALAQVARCMKALSAFGPAEGYLQQALRWTALLPGADARVDLLCELAEVAISAAEAAQRATDHAPDLDRAAIRAARDRARDHSFEAARLAGETTDPHWEVKVLLRISDVLDRCGDHDDAVLMQHRAITLMGLQHEAQSAGEDAATAPLSDLPQLPASTLLM